MTSRRSFLKAAGFAAAGTGFLSRGATESLPPNILFILADDVGRDAIGCYGGTSYPTPNIDHLAEQGMRFEHVYSAPVCHPSRVCLLTGQYPVQLGSPAWGSFPRHAEKRTFAHELKRAGYATAVAGKWQLTLLKKDLDQPHRLGFDEYSLFGWHEGPRYHEPHIWQNGELRDDVGDRYGPDVYCDFLIDFMTRNKEKPFIAYFPMALCHDVSDDFKPPPPCGPGRDRYENFAEMMAEMDRIVGRVVGAVDKLGLGKRTVILFTTDNGTASKTIIRHKQKGFEKETNVSRVGDIGVPGGKGKLTDPGIRVPTIARWHGRIAAGTASEALIDFSDFLPTFNELSGLPAPKYEINGRSFAGLLTGGQHTAREWIYSEARGKYCVRSREWKLCGDGKLYDLVNDPAERKPIKANADTPESVKVRLQLQGIAQAIRKKS